jgi:hypothetical protein
VLSSIALLIDEEDDWKLVLYSPLMVIGYKHLVDLIIIKGVLDVAFRRKGLKWTSSKVQGAGAPMQKELRRADS